MAGSVVRSVDPRGVIAQMIPPEKVNPACRGVSGYPRLIAPGS